MTRTRQWLDECGRGLRVRLAAAAVLVTLASVVAAVVVGVVLGRAGVYRVAPPVVLVVWAGVIVAAVGGVRFYRKRVRVLDATSIASAMERRSDVRRGTLVGVAEDPSVGSEALLAMADRRALAWLHDHGLDAVDGMRRQQRRAVATGAVSSVIGLAALVMVGPGSSGFLSPLEVLRAGRGAITLEIDRVEVRRGDRVTARLLAPGYSSVELMTRAPGERWQGEAVSLDSAGRAEVSLGPLDADRFVRAVAGSRSSATLRIRVALPVFVADLAVLARFPAYLERPDEPVFAGDSVWLPVGTRLTTEGQATVDLSGAAWTVGDRVVQELEVEGGRFRGAAIVREGGHWTLSIRPVSGALDDPPPGIDVVAVPDSAPVVTVPLPGVDTVAPASLRQPIVVDVRDDHRITRVQLESRRVSRLGLAGELRVDTLPLPEGGADRAIVPWALDLNGRGFLPGDTAYYRVRAFDNVPGLPQQAVTEEYALLLPSDQDVRREVREATDALVDRADSLFRQQQELADQTEELVAEGAREGGQAGDEGLDFESAERAAEIGEQQQALMEEADRMAGELEDLQDQGWEAGLTDPEWLQQMEDLQRLLQDAVTPELEDALRQLQDALQRLDPEDMRQALEDLAANQERLEAQLERARELLERAAMEGAMDALAEDSQELARRQEEWNEGAADPQVSDSALAAQEQQLAQEAQQLQDELADLQQSLEDRQQEADLQDAAQQMAAATQQMQRGAQQMRQGDRDQSRQSGQNASQELNQVSEELREQLDRLRDQFREEVLGMLDQAMTETADLAQRQQSISERLSRGEAGADVRGEQTALREGVDQVLQRMQEAASKNALISPDLSTGLGFARLRMSEALEQFSQPTPNTRQAGEMAAQAVDGLNAFASALARGRSEVEGAESATGMAEAMQQMAEMAQEQQSMNGETSSLMPQLPQGGQQLMQQLQQLAQREQALADELERMAAEEGLPGGTEELAEEAQAIAEELARGQVDRETLQRQEELFRRLLDAGRSLRSDEEDERLERESETADPELVRLPAELDPAALSDGTRYPYPVWERLREFSPTERRLILDYFRRLNRARN